MDSTQSTELEPCTEDGWVTDPRALKTVLALKAIRPGDMVRIQKSDDCGYGPIQSWTRVFNDGGEFMVVEDPHGLDRLTVVGQNPRNPTQGQLYQYLSKRNVGAWKPKKTGG